jgi:NAD(P)-dependent dehydrogenase (short-subunit alcohol dehydrogenase family)
VNNAGIGIAAPLEFLPLDELRRQLEVNVVAPVAVSQTFLPLLRRARGRLVHIGSSSGYLSMPLVGPYCASKFALEALADAQRLELQPWGLHVALVQPGAIATPIFDKSNAHADALLPTLPPETERLYAPIIAAIRKGVADQVRRARPPETVARAVLHALTAARPRTRYVVGLDAWLEWVLARWLPDRLRDRALTRFLGLPAAGAG